MARRPLRGLTVAALLLLATAAPSALAGCSSDGPPAAGTTGGMPTSAGAGRTTGLGRTGPSAGAAASEATPADARPGDAATGSPDGDGTGAAGIGPTSAAPGTPDAAALAATTAWFSYDTRLDHRPNDTARRLALTWLAPALRRDVVTFAGDSAPGADWTDWTARHARAGVEAALGGDDHPPDAATTAWRQVVATITMHGDAGWTATTTRTVFVRLDLLDGRWLVADLRTAAPA